jgi:hypothetical protein
MISIGNHSGYVKDNIVKDFREKVIDTPEGFFYTPRTKKAHSCPKKYAAIQGEFPCQNEVTSAKF